MEYEDFIPLVYSTIMAGAVKWVHDFYHQLAGSGIIIDNVGSLALAVFAAIGFSIMTDREKAVGIGVGVGAVHTLHHFLDPAFIGMGEAVLATTFVLGILGLAYDML